MTVPFHPTNPHLDRCPRNSELLVILENPASIYSHSSAANSLATSPSLTGFRVLPAQPQGLEPTCIERSFAPMNFPMTPDEHSSTSIGLSTTVDEQSSMALPLSTDPDDQSSVIVGQSTDPDDQSSVILDSPQPRMISRLLSSDCLQTRMISRLLSLDCLQTRMTAHPYLSDCQICEAERPSGVIGKPEDGLWPVDRGCRKVPTPLPAGRSWSSDCRVQRMTGPPGLSESPSALPRQSITVIGNAENPARALIPHSRTVRQTFKGQIRADAQP